jgi:hypothetical protein
MIARSKSRRQMPASLRNNRLIHLRETPARAEGALSTDWDGAAVERDYRAHAPGFTWFDGLLTADARRELWRFCMERPSGSR